ncbi:MAG: hypothetical protein RI556_05535 [Hydrogenovibrio sp.]|uniref:hypothetical protein n=1 Tax=Hydrogenovibrio sp. TaxID=2065821 RepID=UPI00287050E6|nr:hypothetical protein [Hydrogenovibrio sp.]MDR9498616.1 hypothetical protein [Hydrogenovibrio sp.]
MQHPIIVIGMGELGSVFARGCLKLGYPVQGVRRQDSLQQMAQAIPNPKAVIVAVGEADLHSVMQNFPAAWAHDAVLLQNELLPRDWQASQIPRPTVISVWFEKKPGMDTKVVVPSPVYGKHSKLIFDALATLDIPVVQLDSAEELLFELVRKNVYILTTNIAGLEVGGTVRTLAEEHPALMKSVASDVLDIQDWLTDNDNDRDQLTNGMLASFEGDPEHKCMGRSAPARLKRALSFADEAGLAVPQLRKIAQAHL